MATWLNTMNITAEWEAAEDDAANIPALCKAIIAKLETITLRDPNLEEEKGFIIIAFQDVIDLDSGDPDDFDEVMERLYDWADEPTYGGKVCWIKRF